MALMQLPTEVLLQILENTGPLFFQEDPSRLRVCRRWYSIARMICYEHISLSAGQLSRLVMTIGTADFPSVLKNNLRSLDISLQGNQNWKMSTDETLSKAEVIDLHKHRLWRDGEGRQRLRDYTTALDRHIHELVALLHDSSILKTLCITALREVDPVSNWTHRRGYILSQSMQTLLSLRNLLSLDLDLHGVAFEIQSYPQIHLCAWIREHMTTLKRLRLRLSYICLYAITPIDPSCMLSLNDLVVDLVQSGGYLVPSRGNIAANACDRKFSRTWSRSFINRVQELLPRLTSPSNVRVIFTFMSRVFVYDAIRDEKRILPDDYSWDDYGESFHPELDFEV